MEKTLHFKSSEAYRKYNAYRYIHGEHSCKANYPSVTIHGKKHTVKHSCKLK